MIQYLDTMYLFSTDSSSLGDLKDISDGQKYAYNWQYNPSDRAE